jgi:hypothetical protein
MKKGFFTLAAVAVLVAACGGSSGRVDDSTNTPTPTPVPTQDVAVVTDTLVWDDMEVTLVAAEPVRSSSDYSTPEAGMRFVAFLVEYLAKEDEVSYNPLYWGLVGADGYSYDREIFGSKEPELDSGNNLKAGRKATGWLTFEVPKDVNVFYLQLSDWSHDGEWKVELGN